jgi:thiamine biosynthesis lipoprotein
MKKLSAVVLLLMLFSCKEEPKNIKISGPIFGTSYAVIYGGNINFQKKIDSLFYVINKSMSTYQTNSDISKLNRNETIDVDTHFSRVLEKSIEVYKSTNGIFDPTIGTIVNALGFGPEKKTERIDSLIIDSLMQYVGLDKVRYTNHKVAKKHPQTFIDFNAIAKGYAVDVIAVFLESKNIANYLVEIGGEIRSKGINEVKGSTWTVGIDMPNFDGSQSVLKAITIKDQAMATSGTYRKFKIDEKGNRYAHIIDANSGYPSKSNILSVSVIAEDCMTADAYATAFQAMGIENVSRFLQSHPELQVFLVFENDEQEIETMALNGFPE